MNQFPEFEFFQNLQIERYSKSTETRK